MISFVGCEEKDDEMLPAVTAEFTYSLNPETGTARFINTSENATSYSWNFGNDNESNEVNPIETFEQGSYTVTLTAKNAAGDMDTFESDILYVIVDTQAPVITLLGDATINIKLGETFTDPGATASDDVEGNLTSSIVVSGDVVDINTEATYTITYNVSDAAGNAATEVSRTVIVAAVSCTDESAESINAADLNMTFMTDQTANIIADGANFEWVNNPNADNDLNNSCKVGKITKLGNNPWDNNQINLDAKLDFNANAGLKVKVFSAKAGFAVRIKLEEQGVPDNNTELEVTSTKTNEWEELTFAFDSSNSNKFDKIVLFFDLNANNTDTYYFDDLKVYGTNGGSGGGGETSGAYFYSTSGTLDIVSVWGDWGTGTVQDGTSTEDATYNPSIKLSGGTWGALVAFTEFTKGTMSQYGNLEFKIKTSDATVKVKVPEVELEFNISEGTVLAGGWVQMSIPLSTWAASVIDDAQEFAIWGSGGSTLFITDVMLSGESGNSGGGGGNTDCPAPPTGELLSNGNFEAGDVGCWQFFQGSSISTTVNNGGSQSAQIQGSTGAAVGLKQERFGAGTVQPNTSYTVTFDIMADGPFGEGGVMKAFTFSEGVDGGGVGATLHTLTDNTTAIATSWETKTFTFTTPGNANQVEGGISFLIEIVNSNVKLNVDNVVIKKTP